MRLRQVSTLFAFLVVIGLWTSCQSDVEPEPFGATPSARQLSWQELDYYAFVHFNINTFSDVEWGEGSESPEIFNPTQLDCRQWARVCKEAGMKGIIITAKHHDGFCLWNSAYTEHDVASSPWRNGEGDVLRELAEACQEYGLKMGVYLSPWDRNSDIYGTPEYNEYFKKQLAEVLTGYGDLFEVWFDGAVGEEFRGQQIYDWDGFIATVREHQPNAVIFSDAGPDIRWVGTEQGFANPTNWSTLNRDDYFPGTPRYLELRSGNQGGTHWLPAEVDVSIRPGWYYHADEDSEVKSAEHLELIYYNSVGRNANLLLNLPLDRRGLVHPNDSAALMQLRQRLDATFTENLAKGAEVTATDQISTETYQAEHLVDGDGYTAWAAPEGVTSVGIELDFPEAQTFNVIELREDIRLGQRVEAFEVKAWLNDNWQSIGKGTTIGNRRYLRLPTVTTRKVRVRIKQAMAAPVMSEIALYHRPHANYLLESKQDFSDRMQWWRDAGFGMFIHWGAYAVPAGIYQGREVSGIGEWIMFSAKIPVPEYEKFVHRFNPQEFDAEEWVRIAKEAGMKYMVITSKHHDGFCLWDSQVTEYDIMDATPFKRDILKELSDACQREGIQLCFYHSIMDWHHKKAKGSTFAEYRENYLKPQLKELVEQYDPAVLWFDGEWIDEWSEAQGKDLYQYVRSLKPEIIINNRVGKGRNGMQGMNTGDEFVGDFGTPEQEILEHGSADIDWESCMTMNDTWGFKKNDHNWKSAEMLIHNLVDIAAKGGNYLLNVGPDATGIIPEPSQERLAEMGNWMQINGEAIYNTRMWPQYKEGDHIRYIQGNDGTVYVALLKWPGVKAKLRFIRPKGKSEVRLLGWDEALEWSYDDATGTTIDLGSKLQDAGQRPGHYAWVLKMEGTLPKVAPTPSFKIGDREGVVEEIFANQLEVVIQAEEGEDIYYTLDESTPTTQSERYDGRPIALTETTTLKAIGIKEGSINSPVAEGHFQKSRFNSIELEHNYASQYSGGGHLGLIDGKNGSTRFKDGHWQGFEGVNLQATIDLGKSESITAIRANFLQDLGAWIFPPKRVRFQVSEDGENYREVYSFVPTFDQKATNARIHQVLYRGSDQMARYVRVVGENVGRCPSWHAGAGGKAWLFVDEIQIE